MAEKSLKEMRDEVAFKVFTDEIDNALFNRNIVDAEMLKEIARGAFEAAEAFLAARYDADNKPSRAT
jgi:hypothetical protein